MLVYNEHLLFNMHGMNIEVVKTYHSFLWSSKNYVLNKLHNMDTYPFLCPVCAVECRHCKLNVFRLFRVGCKKNYGVNVPFEWLYYMKQHCEWAEGCCMMTWFYTNASLSIHRVNPKKFKIALKKFLHTYSFYTIEEYLSLSWIKNCITRVYYSGILI